ncbi:FtsX-like permease family protein [Geodermatophilus sabuli]|uniref:Putative ABC transport system permease protein n=1 Tax=Geodermatophilus sabuli TaxID=1564158 RepID=A0A285E5W5_9ACTN|nr:FtsX-like permease family protein [Geodermatophilus sabuli]MBB3082872.1 putative ABC transport system permease protein [Geodermatophilus sabuli]SNX94263.1 putative ABC transport system permease protein [Geodermatophilus sabuli]
MRSVVLAQLRTHAARLVASTLAVVIAVGFVVATLVLNQTARSTVLAAVGAQYVDTAAVVTSDDGTPLDGAVDTVAALPSIRAVAPTWETSVQATVPDRTGSQYLLIGAVAADPGLRWQQLSAGSLPDAPGEVAVSDRARADVGDVLTVTASAADGQEATSQVTVTGIVDLRGDPEAGLHGRGFVVPEQALAWGATDPVELRLAAAPGVSDEQVRADVATALQDSAVTVRTGDQQAVAAAAAMMGNASALAAVLLVFGTVAVLVAGLVIANTFAVLLAQRTRELALLRCVGATARQVRRSVLGEALVTGLAASTIGAVAGVGLAAAVSAMVGDLDSPIPLAGISVPWYAVVIGLAVGTLTTLLAALAPARAATRVAPLAALRPADQAPLRSRPGVLRLALGLVLLLPGIALMALGVVMASVLVALPGGVLSFLGVVLLAQRAVPPVVAAAGRLAAWSGGVPARLAAGNATRDPRRTAATATALLIGVTLTTAMVVGAASTKASATAGLEAEFPADVVVEGLSSSLPDGLLTDLRALELVTAGTALTAAEVTGPDGEQWEATGVDRATALPALRSTDDLALPDPGEVLLPEWLAESWSVTDGDRVQLAAGDRTGSFLAQVVGETPLLMTAADLATVAPDAGVGALWLRLADVDDAARTAAVDAVTDTVGSASSDVYVGGILTVRAQLEQVLDTLLLVVTGLLSIAVVIALIGVGNTLALSVVERRQENGLLRAMGLTRRQLRGLLAWEAALVAGVAAVLGVLLGTAYGLVGSASVLGQVADIVLVVPWLRVAAIVVVATVAGLLASVLPARRAVRASPVAAIAG